MRWQLMLTVAAFATFTTGSIVNASDPVRIENSTNDLVDEIKDALDAGFLTSDYSQYIPGYGFHLFVEKSRSLPQLDEAIAEISATLDENSDSVVGLPSSEWLSIFFRAANEYDLLIRMRHANPSSLEIWVNGERE